METSEAVGQEAGKRRIDKRRRPKRDTADEDPEGISDGSAEEWVVDAGEADEDTGAVEPDEPEKNEECLPPHVVDLMAGGNFPTARALCWCGWSVSFFETWPAGDTCNLMEGCHGSLSEDLLSDKVQVVATGQFKKTQASWSAMDCKTLSSAREMLIPGHPKPPRQLRRVDDLWGAGALGSNTLNQTEARTLKDLKELLRFNFEAMAKVEGMNQGNIVPFMSRRIQRKLCCGSSLR